MTRNKDRGYYYVTYTCLNCQNKISRQIQFGTPIPTMVTDFEKQPEKFRSYHLPAPECDVCGCNYWSHGKVENDR